MKKTAKKIVFSIFVVIIICLSVFVLGWSNLYVNPGEYGVMISKTNGVDNKIITSGEFNWKWQKLLPTNVVIRKFSLSPYQSSQSVSGSLPSASVYSMHLDDHPDFTYRIDLNIELSVKEDKILDLVKDLDLKDQSELDAYLENKAKLLTQYVMDYILDNADSNRYLVSKALNSSDLKKITESNEKDFNDINLNFVEIVSCRIPDFDMYNLAKESFVSYQEALNSSMEQRVKEQAEKRVEEDRTIEQLEKFAVLLKKYPQLEELSKNGSINDIINTLRNIKN